MKDISQKRLASLIVELLSVITMLKYKSGYDTIFSSSTAQKPLKVHTYPSAVISDQMPRFFLSILL